MVAILDDKITLIRILDILATCILIPTTPPTILKFGGTLMHLGIMMSLTTAARLFSAQIYKEMRKILGPRSLLKYSLIASTVVNALLIFTTSYWTILLNRVLYFSVNHVSEVCSELTPKENKDDSVLRHPQKQRLILTLTALGIVGFLIDMRGGFYVLATLATTVSIVAMSILFQMEPNEKEGNKLVTPLDVSNVIQQTSQKIIREIRKVDIDYTYWRPLSIKSLLVINDKVVFILFVVMIKFVFQGSGAIVCATSAHQSVILFLIVTEMDLLRNIANNFGAPRDVLEKLLIAAAICGLLQVFSPTHTFYLFMFVLFAIFRNLAVSYYVDVFGIKHNPKLKRDVETVSVVTEIVAPLFIGMFFHLFKQNAYRILVVLPIVAIYHIVKNQTEKSTSIKVESIKEKLKSISKESDKNK